MPDLDIVGRTLGPHRTVDRYGDPVALGLRLRAAREASGFTQSRVGRELDVARTTIVAIEKGERSVRPEELVLLARLYGREVSSLLQREAPQAGLVVQLRGSQPKKLDSALMSESMREFEALCEDYLYLENLCGLRQRRRYPPEYDLDGVDAEAVAEDIAIEERRRLGLGDGPISNLREVLETEVGIRVFLISLPSEVAGMYAFTESAGACVALNQEQPVERRRMSLAHEFGHFLTSRFQSETLMEGRYERRPKAEIFAEAFARAFLMTSSGIRRRFIDLQRERSGALSRGDLLRLANRFEVSAEAMVRRLEELRLIPGGTWDRLQAEGLRIRDAQRLLGIQPVRDEDPLPERYVALAVEAWEAGELSEGQVARLLRESRLDVRNRLARDHEARDLDLGSQLGLPLVAAAGG